MNKFIDTKIEYIYITKKAEQINLIYAPQEFENNVLKFIKVCPKDILQLRSPVDYYESELISHNRNCLNFNVIYEENFFELVDFIPNKNKIFVFLIDMQQINSKLILEKIKSSFSVHYIISLPNNARITNNKYIQKPQELVSRLQKDLQKIKNKLGISFDFEITLKSEGFDKHNEFIYFSPAIINFCILNQIIGNYWTNPNLKTSGLKEIADKSAEAQKDWYSKDRQLNLLEQIKKNDFFIKIALKEGFYKKESCIHPTYSTLILSAPSHNPRLKEILGINKNSKDLTLKAIVRLLKLEQTINYIALLNSELLKDNLEVSLAIQKVTIERQEFLDNVSFLHATFFNSPYLRCPIKGSSIYQNLIFFDPENFKKRKHDKFRRKIKNAIFDLGKKLASELLIPEIQELIKKRNGQIFIISDLPIEWLLIDNIPLAFTHDICRMPENPLHGLMANYVLNNQIKYNVTKDILSKTLVIYGTKEEKFSVWHNQVEKLKAEFKFNTIYCKSLSEVTDAIEFFKPELLIFDCHGDYDKDTFSTFLWIENEKLTSSFIIENKISAPLIFLSSCGTAPTFGTVNSIANAFFEMGTLSVTTTYLPVNINLASLLYIRLLYKLDYAAKHGIHKNWLEFVSHLTRTSGFIEAYDELIKQNKITVDSHKFFNQKLKDLTYLLDFNNRRQLYREIDEKIETFDANIKKQFSNNIPEYLFYSNLGRGDLIYFNEWHNRIKDRIQKKENN